MSHFARISALTILISLLLSQSASAKFAVKQTRQVPISRLLRNIEYQRADAVSSTDRAMVDFRIGRLHAMAYALDVDQAPCDASARPGSKYELPDFGHEPDHLQFKLNNKRKNSPAARAHLRQSVEHLQAALKTDPTLAAARLGLAWCVEQSEDRAKALSLYRQVFAYAYDGEKNAKGGMYDWSIACEAATYLIPLLDPVKDRQELAQVKSKVAQLERLPRCVTPIVIPLSSSVPFQKLLQNHKVRFDLDGFGARYYSKWTGPQTAWLVIDPEGSGKIESGLKLVGQSSFWIFWQNGYEVLRGLDDNHDGIISGPELKGLALWQDANANGISEPGEVKPLSSFGIVGLKVRSRKNSEGILWNKSGVMLKDGTSRPSYDIILPAALPAARVRSAAATKPLPIHPISLP